MILAGDIGGTKTILGMATWQAGTLHLQAVEAFESQRHRDLAEIVRRYLAQRDARVERACFGVAGPVVCGEATITNLPWRLSEKDLEQDLGVPDVVLINDLTALAYAVPALQPADLVTLQPGIPDPTGPIGLLAPGTGLGQGYLFWDGKRYLPGASEGGHADLAPADALQSRLLASLREQYGHVSWERVLSGPGLLAIYRFLRAESGPEPAEITQQMASRDPSAVISAHALAGTDAVCLQALEIFVAMMGAQAGNLALTLMSTGGIYLGGGIPPKILPILQQPQLFLSAFRAKGRLAPVLERIPVHVIRNTSAQLLGAAACALARSNDTEP